MLRFITCSTYVSLKDRKTPFIMYFKNENEEYCFNVICTLEKLCKSFPYVFCYYTCPKKFPIKIGGFCLPFENVYSFKNKTIDKIVSGTSYSELFDLFQYVYNLCMTDFHRGYSFILKLEFGSNFSMKKANNGHPNYKRLAKNNSMKIQPIARHKYSDSELRFMSSLKNCQMENTPNFCENIGNKV